LAFTVLDRIDLEEFDLTGMRHDVLRAITTGCCGSTIVEGPHGQLGSGLTN